ncbi:TolC family outer membrane protein [Paucibacter sp. APW11]|uniref:TolC family outer membrane protein n=1 Tax=Roseateles aquae TaxID=3077235 RepID=A0ABU3P925_9BURK|nr:TolC family outer membrane protein [Paucibacter sp. APW11]MDT8998998.1 TolC family outer membrane protein [Paucibacter sp. APW11]
MAADRRNTQRAKSAPRLRQLSLALALGLAGAAGAQAQSLQELYDAARAYDASYLAARAQADSAQFKAAQADASLRPTLGLGVSGTNTQTQPPSNEGTFVQLQPGVVVSATPGTPNSFTKQVSGDRVSSTTWQGGLNAKYSLYNRSNNLSVDQAQRALGVAASDLEIAEQDLIVRVAQAYFDVLAAQDTLATSRANKSAIAEQLASAKRNFEVGTATITDTREAQAKYDLAVAQEIGADNDLRVKRVTLDQLVGRNGVEPKPLAVPVALPAITPTTPDSWVSQAEELHPGIRKAKLGLEVAQLETSKAKAADGPTVDVTGTLGVQNQSGSGAQLAGTTKNASIGVQLSYPLYSGGYNQNRIKETLKLEEKSRNDLDFARRSVVEGTRRAFFGVQSGAAQVKALEAAESSTKLALEATQLGYKVGVRVNLDVLNAQTQLYSTQSQLAKARYDVLVGGLKLRQASGQLRPEDIAALNQLLAK